MSDAPPDVCDCDPEVHAAFDEGRKAGLAASAAPVSDAKEREARLLAEAREIIEEALDEDAQDGYRLAPSLEADMRGFLNASSPDYRPVSGEDR